MADIGVLPFTLYLLPMPENYQMFPVNGRLLEVIQVFKSLRSAFSHLETNLRHFAK